MVSCIEYIRNSHLVSLASAFEYFLLWIFVFVYEASSASCRYFILIHPVLLCYFEHKRSITVNKTQLLKSYVDYNTWFLFKIMSVVCRWPVFIFLRVVSITRGGGGGGGEFYCFVFVSKLEAFIIMPRNCTKISSKVQLKKVANELRCCGPRSGRCAALVDIQATHWICANARKYWWARGSRPLRARFELKVETGGSKGQTQTLSYSVKCRIVTALLFDILVCS